ncbi:hypothetical protein ACNVED_05520 [Legionella sp. D16C41]|uniref:hypothetical protein n=1 Tax=Legionella sp. D16C41 TaxID=3402688 RepID=UPI003AF81514
MEINKKNSLCNYEIFLNEPKKNFKNKNRIQPLITIRKKKLFKKNPLPKFLDWLRRQINSGNKRFALDSQDLILYKPSAVQSKLLFILPEVFKQYYKYSGVCAKLIQLELKKSLAITFNYTIVRDGKVIEVFPCQFLDLI